MGKRRIQKLNPITQTMRVQAQYEALPQHILDKIFWVGKQYRTHIWSKIEGGSDIIIQWKDLRVSGYCNIKAPSKYLETLWSRYDDLYGNLTDDEKLDLARKLIFSIYVRNEVADAEDIQRQKMSYSISSSTKDFAITSDHYKEVWNEESDDLPATTLKRYDNR